MATASSTLNSTNYGSGNDRFNAEALSWDSNPFVHSASQHAWTAIQQFVPELSTPDNTVDVLELGCGTGLLTLLTAQHARSVVAVDAAQGMISVLEKKIADAPGRANVRPVCTLLVDPEDKALPPADEGGADEARKKFDLITSHLVLHHIPDLRAVLKTMFGCLKPGGQVALTDFEDDGPEAKRFHPQAKMEGVERHGIKRVWMEGVMREVGFEDVRVVEGWRMKKYVEKWDGEFGTKREEGMGEIREFPFVICLGKRARA